MLPVKYFCFYESCFVALEFHGVNMAATRLRQIWPCPVFGDINRCRTVSFSFIELFC